MTARFSFGLMLAAISIVLTSMSASLAQAPTPAAKPKAPGRPALQTPAETANSMAQAERLALQSDLAWVGQYNGAITGEVSERMVAAIKEFQKARGGRETGALNPQERDQLADTAKRRQDNVGWKIVTDPGTGVRLGIPGKLVPQQTSDANGARWTSPTGTIQIQLARRKEDNPTTAKLAERERKEPPGRTVDYTVVKPDFFVLSGLQGLKKFYLRGTFKGDEVRILTILYDQATENTVEPVVIAMSSAFNAFPNAAQAPAQRKTVEYGTGIVVSDDGTIVTDRQLTDGCLATTIGGRGNAERIAEDRDHGLALLRLYGARGLTALNIAAGRTKSSVDLIGIADPQNQDGGNTATSVKASVAQAGRGNDLALSPAPVAGFSGAAALDGDGKFAGIALVKPAVVATASNTAPMMQAVLVPADTVLALLKANNVAASGVASDAKASVVRVICVHK